MVSIGAWNFLCLDDKRKWKHFFENGNTILRRGRAQSINGLSTEKITQKTKK
jgi:hypothetical protein